MRNLLKILGCLVALIVFANCGCENFEDDLVTVLNRSNDTINVIVSFNYPDTCMPDVRNQQLRYYTYRFKPADKAVIKILDITRDKLFSRNNVVQLFVIKSKYYSLAYEKGGEYMQSRGLVLKRYEFSKEELGQMNWTVVFPGNTN